MGSEAAIEVTSIEPFSCSTDMLAASVQIEPGDVLGACVGQRRTGGNREQLNLVGTDATGFSVSGVSVSDCPSAYINSVTVTELTNFSDRILHLSAEFGELLDNTHAVVIRDV